MSTISNDTILEQGAEGKLQENSEQYDFFIDSYPEMKTEEAYEYQRNYEQTIVQRALANIIKTLK